MQERIAVTFDFDDTLGPDSTTVFLKQAGLKDIAAFWKDVGQMMKDGWDPVPAYLHHMVETSKSADIDALEAWGKSVPLFQGVEDMFSHLRKVVKDANPRISLEFYLISSGIGDVLRQTSIADEFTDIWASEFHYDEHGQAVTPRRVISFTDKTRYIFQVQKVLLEKKQRANLLP